VPSQESGAGSVRLFSLPMKRASQIGESGGPKLLRLRRAGGGSRTRTGVAGWILNKSGKPNLEGEKQYPRITATTSSPD
jgi:hypothetical protein